MVSFLSGLKSGNEAPMLSINFTDVSLLMCTELKQQYKFTPITIK